jgi:hypothetical protein
MSQQYFDETLTLSLVVLKFNSGIHKGGKETKP